MPRSKRRLFTKEPPEPVFFTDRDLGSKIFPPILRNAGLFVEAHADHFHPETEDEEWLRAVAKRGWVILTHDKRIRYRSLQTDAVMRSGLRLFVLIGRVSHRELAENFVKALGKIRRFLKQHDHAFIAKVFRDEGRVEMWLSHEAWMERRSI
jgi:hypothetical protein